MIEYQIKRSARRTVSVEVSTSGQVFVRAPKRLTELEIRQFVERKLPWIEKHVAMVQEEQRRSQDWVKRQPEISISQLMDQARNVIPGRVKTYAARLQVRYGRITVRCQKTRWGSCSWNGNLNFNCLLMLAPPEVLDYVVVHELCHRLEMNHSAKFWAEVRRVMPDYQEKRRWLRVHGAELMALHGKRDSR